MDGALASLRNQPLFESLGDEALGMLASQLVPQKFAAGEFIFRRGDPGGGLFLVTAGQVELFVTNNTGQKLLLETVEARSFFGEVSLLDGEARDRIRSDAEYEANIRSSLEVTQLHVKLDHFEALVISRLDALGRGEAKSPRKAG